MLVNLQGQSARLQQNRRCEVTTGGRRSDVFFFFSSVFRSPASLQRQTVRVAGQGTPDTWSPGICPGWEEHKAAIITANNVHGRTMRPQPFDTHKQLVGHNHGRLASVHVDFDNIAVPRAIQQLIVWRRSEDKPMNKQR